MVRVGKKTADVRLVLTGRLKLPMQRLFRSDRGDTMGNGYALRPREWTCLPSDDKNMPTTKQKSNRTSDALALDVYR